MNKTYVYILIMALVTFLVRALPLTVLKKPIKNRFVRSFLYYVPYVTLSVMTFPSILNATGSPISASVALCVGILLAWFGADLIKVSSACCLTVFIIELIVL